MILVGPAVAKTTRFQSGNTHVLLTVGHPNTLEATTIEYVKILGQTSGNDNCKARLLPKLVVVEPAKHGFLCNRDEVMPLRYAGKLKSERCVVTDELFRMVYFRPKGHFVGADSFRYAISYRNAEPKGVVHVDLTLTPNPSAALPGKDEALSGAAQKVGPLPACVQVMM